MIYYVQNGNGPGRDTPACDSPNPPFWCDQNEPEPGADISIQAPYIAGFIAVSVVIYIIYKEFKRRKCI